MSKQKKNRQLNRLSPENYIRQRARNLPIYKCWVNKDWKYVQVATIFISRRHVSGKVTFAIYIVDLLCQGVQDTIYRHNVPEATIKLMHEGLARNKIQFIEIPYKLAHNIIYAGIEFAEEFGLHPVADFTRVTQYLLEEDTEDIPLIHIRCGDENGNPRYTNSGGYDSAAKEKRIHAHLNNLISLGKYKTPEVRKSRKEIEQEKRKEEYEKLKLSYKEMTPEEIKACFSQFIRTKPESSNPQEQWEYFDKGGIIADVIIESIVDEEKVSKFTDKFTEDFDVNIVDIFELPNSYFAGLSEDTDKSKLRNTYWKYIRKLTSDIEDITPILEKLRKEIGDIPVIYYLDLRYNKKLSKSAFKKRALQYLKAYPDYLMLKIQRYSSVPKLHHKLKTVLSETQAPITIIEFMDFLYSYAKYCLFGGDHTLEKVVAFEGVMYKYENKYQLPAADGIMLTLWLMKMALIAQHYGVKNKDIK